MEQDQLTVAEVLESIAKRLHLSKETESEVLEEIRTHLEDAVADAVAQGGDAAQALRTAAEKFGVDETAAELQEIHSDREAVNAILATALPVLFALVLRWLTFIPGGSVLDWSRILVQPGFWILAAAALVIPVACFRRWRFALVGWSIFWLLSVIFVVFPHVNRW